MFLDKLEVIHTENFDFMDEGNITKCGHRVCEWLQISSNLSLSVQASSMHYCTPRAYIDLDKYTHFEMAIIWKDIMSDDYDMMEDFPRYEELKECYSYGIFAYVPKDLINDLYYWCLENFNK